MIVGLTTFLVVTSEMMPVGVLTPLAQSLQVSVGLAGVSLTITGVIAAVVAVLAPVLAGRLDRRIVLAGFMLVLSAANAL
ncbi:MAG: MFS transporter, partial [Arachnia sp.]